jgi:hypothetical protein
VHFVEIPFQNADSAYNAAQMIKSICVFCGSSLGSNPRYREAAVLLGGEIARRGFQLVYGGGVVGLMGAVADAALEAKGEVIGIIPYLLKKKEVGPSCRMRLSPCRGEWGRSRNFAKW